MGRRLKFQEMVRFARQSLEKAPDHRKGKNSQYEIADAGLGAYSDENDHVFRPCRPPAGAKRR
jgi:hypothetical protein